MFAGVGPGWGLSAYFSYLKGVSNELAMKHVPWVAPRNDTYAGPVGRRGDMVRSTHSSFLAALLQHFGMRFTSGSMILPKPMVRSSLQNFTLTR